MIYSNGRLKQATQTVANLATMSYFKTFDLIQVCDGEPNKIFDGFRPIIVPRKTNHFCRADLWNAGINTSKRKAILILDCDRIIDENFVNAIVKIDDGEFIYSKLLYQLYEDKSNDELNDLFRKSLTGISDREIKEDFRTTFQNGTVLPNKNPMSGCVAFTNKTYLNSGGMSDNFISWGFNDTDYYTKCYFNGFKFVETYYNEFHLKHDYEIDGKSLLLTNIWNAIGFYNKWHLPTHNEIKKWIYKFEIDVDSAIETNLDDFLVAYKNA